MDITGALTRSLSLAAAAALLLAGCSASGAGTPAPVLSPAPSSSSEAPVASDPLLESLGVDGLDGRQIVDLLDRVPGPERRADVMASVRADVLLVSDAEREVSVPLPAEEFYVSIAPFVEGTHECYYHSLTTCQGELAGAVLDVTITTSTGEVLLDGEVTTYDNGFAGFWLPRGATGTIELVYGELSATYSFSTDDDAPTCVTTVQLA